MKRIFFLLTAIFLSVIVFGQGVDLSGTWKLNTSKSKLGDQFTMSPKEVIITHSGNNLSVEKYSEFQGQEFTTNDKFTLDGEECVNPGFQGSQKKSTAVWSDDKKSLKITTKFPMGDGGEDMTIVEVFAMTGSNLSIELSASSSYGDMSETGVYDKQ